VDFAPDRRACAFRAFSLHGSRVTRPEGRAKFEMARCLPGFLLDVKCDVFPSGGDRSKHKGGRSGWNLLPGSVAAMASTGSVPGADAFRWPWAERRGPWPTICGGWAERRFVWPRYTRKTSQNVRIPCYGFYPSILSSYGV